MSISKSSKNLSETGRLTTYQAGILQSSMHRRLRLESEQALSPFGITKMQWLILGAVLDAGADGIRPTDLAKALGTSMAYLTNQLTVLRSRKLLERVPHQDDQRASLLRATAGLQKQAPKIERALRDHLRETIYAKVAPADFQKYIKVLRQLHSL